MTKVFIGGSRSLGRLNPEVRHRLDTIMEKGHQVLIGDASGADKAVQAYLNSQSYSDVQVFCVGDRPRNNVGDWRIRSIQSDESSDRREHFTVKDRAMANEASVGFMVWDGESLGTLLNVFRLASAGKKVLVYQSPSRKFMDVTSMTDWAQMSHTLAADQLVRLDQLLKKEPTASATLKSEGGSAQQELSL
jgi:adenine-specific DNA-methyltransferase